MFRIYSGGAGAEPPKTESQCPQRSCAARSAGLPEIPQDFWRTALAAAAKTDRVVPMGNGVNVSRSNRTPLWWTARRILLRRCRRDRRSIRPRCPPYRRCSLCPSGSRTPWSSRWCARAVRLHLSPARDGDRNARPMRCRAASARGARSETRCRHRAGTRCRKGTSFVSRLGKRTTTLRACRAASSRARKLRRPRAR